MIIKVKCDLCGAELAVLESDKYTQVQIDELVSMMSCDATPEGIDQSISTEEVKE